MSRVLVAGGAGALGAAVVRRLLADPAYEVRVADRRQAPQWMREGCEVRVADLGEPAEARAAIEGCELAIHLAAESEGASYTVLAGCGALDRAIVGAAVEQKVRRLLYVSCASVLERASVFPTPEEHLDECPPSRSALGRAKLAGEALCRAAAEEHGLASTICRPAALYGGAGGEEAGGLVEKLLATTLAGGPRVTLPCPPEQTLAPTHVEDAAEAVLAAIGSEEAAEEDFNVCWEGELTAAELVRLAWQAGGGDVAELSIAGPPSAVAPGGGPLRSRPSAEKARGLLGWEARVEPADGIAELAAALRR